MKAWEDLVATALLGTERRALPVLEAPGGVGRALAALGGEQDAHLLRAAALLGLARRAGRAAPRDEGPAEAPCPADPRPLCPQRAGAALAWILAEALEFLPEWLDLARERGCRPPEETLPALLEAVRSRPDLLPEVRAAAGPRGDWLARVGPGGSFDDGTLEERGLALRLLRQRDPEAARRLLEAGWRGETVEARVELLSALEVRLGPEDEPFLEAALGDRRREVRARAAALLARMPGSALVARMKSRAAGVLAWSGGALQVRVPAPDASAVRDGLSTRARSGMGDKAGYLREILARIPATWWERRLGADPRRLVAAALASDWAQALLEGWAAAATGDPRWARALLDIPQEVAGLPELLRSLSPADREGVLLDVLPPRALAEGDPRVAGLAACEHPWSATFSRRVVVPLARRAVREGGGAPARLLEEVAARVHPSVLGDLRGVLHKAPAGRLAAVLRTLDLRLAMRRAWRA